MNHNLIIAETCFKKIRESLLQLEMEIDYEPDHVELSMDIFEQPGLDFDINLNLQNNDELHISTKHIDCALFPADSENVAKEFSNWVIGLVNGNYRIVKYSKNGKLFKANLQRPEGKNWKTVYTEFNSLKMPWISAKQEIIINTKAKLQP